MAAYLAGTLLNRDILPRETTNPFIKDTLFGGEQLPILKFDQIGGGDLFYNHYLEQNWLLDVSLADIKKRLEEEKILPAMLKAMIKPNAGASKVDFSTLLKGRQSKVQRGNDAKVQWALKLGNAVKELEDEDDFTDLDSADHQHYYYGHPYKVLEFYDLKGQGEDRKGLGECKWGLVTPLDKFGEFALRLKGLPMKGGTEVGSVLQFDWQFQLQVSVPIKEGTRTEGGCTAAAAAAAATEVTEGEGTTKIVDFDLRKKSQVQDAVSALLRPFNELLEMRKAGAPGRKALNPTTVAKNLKKVTKASLEEQLKFMVDYLGDKDSEFTNSFKRKFSEVQAVVEERPAAAAPAAAVEAPVVHPTFTYEEANGPEFTRDPNTSGKYCLRSELQKRGLDTSGSLKTTLAKRLSEWKPAA